MTPAKYREAGFALVPIPHGTQGPNRHGWNLRENCSLPDDWAGNIGLAHAYSGTCSLDLDRLAEATAHLKEHGIDVNVLLSDQSAVRISSGRPDRAKLLYRLATPLPSKSLAKGAFELRCATAEGLTIQDVLPPSIHPETGKPYEWVGDFTKIPPIPSELLTYWQELCKPKAKASESPLVPMPELRRLLEQHSPNAPYDAEEGDSFIKIGMAVHAGSGGSAEGFDLWHEFLKAGTKYEEGRPHLRSHWRSFDGSGGITANWLRKGLAIAAEEFSQLAEVDDIDLTSETVGDKNLTNERPQPVKSDSPDKPWPLMRRKKNGRIEPCYLNIYNAVSSPDFCGMHIGYDTFRAEFMQSCGSAPDRSRMEPFGDNHYGRLRRALETRGFDSTSTDNVRQAVAEVAALHTFDTAADWLNGLKHDGIPRVADFLSTHFGAEENEYSQAVSMYLWTALAARVLSPGCQADMAVILVSSQGERKSTGISSLVPRPEQFVELNLDETDDDLARKMSGCLIGELAELRGLATRDLEGIKSFITRKHEKWVPKYKEFAHTYPRRLIFIGTTNKREFLADETGERRFLPIDVQNADPEAIQRDRDQLWAEGKLLYELAGIAWQRAETLGRQAVKGYKVTDSWDDPIASWLSGDGIGGTQSRSLFTTAEVASGALGIEPRHVNRGIEMRISKSLHGIGFEKKKVRIGTATKWAWVSK